MIYFDTSALVKRYVTEKGSEKLDEMLAGNPFSATSKLTYAEILSAFTRRYREGEYSKNWLLKIIGNFETEIEEFSVVDVKYDLLPIVKQLLLRHDLRGSDAIHLASAIWLKNVLKENITFAASDANLLKAGEKEGLIVINPQD